MPSPLAAVATPLTFSLAGWTGAPPQVLVDAPPMPICIGPAAPNAFEPLCTPGRVVSPSSLSILPIPASTTHGTWYCAPSIGLTSSSYASGAIAYARAQIGKPYLWGGTGPDAFDCSGLVMMAYRAVGIDIPRTSQQQWKWGPRVSPGQAEPGDLVFFVGGDGTGTAPGHVGIVIGHGLMIDAPYPGTQVRVEPYSAAGAVGFTRPWAHAGVKPGARTASG